MRILVTVPWGSRLGGAEEMLQLAIEGFPHSGHELEFVFFEPGPWPDEIARAGFHVEVIAAGRLRHPARLAATIVRLARVFRRRRPDVILNWMTKTQLYGSPAAVLAGMADRVVWWQHGIADGHWLERCATALPAAAIGCSSSAAARAQAKLSPARPMFTVAAGSRTPEWHSGAPVLQLPAGVPVLGIVGRLQPWKGQDRLLGAQAILHERGHRVHTVVVGGDAYGLSSDYAASLPALVSRLNLHESVTMTGQVPDAGPYIELMDILVNASDPEPFGIVLLEGMARGIAVVAVDSGGPAEFIADQRTGILAPSGEPAALADALELLLVSPELRKRVAAAGRQRYLEEFTGAAMCERLFRALESQLGPGGRR